MTPEERALVTPDEFEAWIRETIQAHPEGRNAMWDIRDNPDRGPQMPHGCVYTGSDRESHCLIGQVLATHDPEALPRLRTIENHEGADIVLTMAGYGFETAAWARAWQQRADRGGSWGRLATTLATDLSAAPQ